jgi:hypothetical protein
MSGGGGGGGVGLARTLSDEEDLTGFTVNIFELASEAEAIALSVAISTAVIDADNKQRM